MNSPKIPLDLLIITAVYDEFKAVLDVDSGALPGSEWMLEQPVDPGGENTLFENEIYIRTFECADHKKSPMRVAVTYATEIGQIASTEKLAALINCYTSRCLAMCGNCAGRRGKVALGDVIIADGLWTYDGDTLIAENDATTGLRKEVILADPLYYKLDVSWKNKVSCWDIDRTALWLKNRPHSYEAQELWILSQLYNGQDPMTHPEKESICKDWEVVLQRLWDNDFLEQDTQVLTERGNEFIAAQILKGQGVVPQTNPFQIHIGHIGTGSQVMEDTQIFNRLTKDMDGVLGLEMEVSAIGSVQHCHHHDIPRMIVMKGVQDFADPKNNNNFRYFSARAAAECLLAFVREHLESDGPQDDFDDILDSGIRNSPDIPTPSALLDGRHQVVPFFESGRRELLQDLEQWYLSETVAGLCLIYADGGMGKTRLLTHLSQQLKGKGWVSGYLKESAPTDWFDRLCSLHQPILVIIDYAESRANLQTLLKPCLNHYHTGGLNKIRVVLLSRNAGDWWQALLEKEPDIKAIMAGIPPLELSPLATTILHRKEIVNQATQIFSQILQQPQTNHIFIDLNARIFDRVLYLHMAALAIALGLDFHATSLLEKILDHERGFWKKPSTIDAHEAVDQSQEDALILVNAATLIGGIKTSDQAESLASRLLDNPQNSENLAHLHQIYGQKNSIFLDRLQPDLFGEAMVLTMIRDFEKNQQQPETFLTSLFADASSAQLQHGFEMLGRIETKPQEAVGEDTNKNEEIMDNWFKAILNQETLKSDEETINDWIKIILKQDLKTRTIPAFLAARNMAVRAAFSPLADSLYELLAQQNQVELAAMIDRIGIPKSTVTLQKLAKWVNQTLLTQHSEINKHEDVVPAPAPAPDTVSVQEQNEAERARLLNKRSVKQSELKQQKAGLLSASEAVEICHKLVQKNPDTFLSDLTMSLNNLGNAQRESDQRESALVSISEAVECNRKLALKNPDTFLPDLAKSLNNLGAIKSELGQRESALASVSESVEIRRKLITKNPATYMADFAMSLNNLGAMQSELSHRKSALASGSESVEIYRKLAQKNPDDFMTDLGMSLNNLGAMQSELNQWEEAAKCKDEALDIYWPFFQKNPQAFAQNVNVIIRSYVEILHELKKEAPQKLTERADAFIKMMGLSE